MKFTTRQLRYINFFASSGLSAAYIFGKTLNANNLKAQLEVKTDDNKVLPVPPNIKHLVNEVLNDMKFSPKEKARVEPFMCTNTDIRHVGFSFWGTGAYLGIPQHFLFDADNPMNFFVEVNGSKLPENSLHFEHLKRAMCLSNDAKKFAIAQEIYLSQHTDIIPCGFLPLVIVVKCNILSVALDKISSAALKPNPTYVHCFIFFMGAWLFALVNDLLSVFSEGESDFFACKLGDSYVRGGIEYYTKMIQRNKILKSFNKSAPYTENGDRFTSYIRTNHMSLPRRLVYLNKIRNGRAESVWHYVFYAG